MDGTPIEKKYANEEDFEEEVRVSSSLVMAIDTEERLPTIHRGVEASSRAFTSLKQTSFCIRFTKESTDRQPAGHNASSYDLPGVWQPPLSGAVDGVENWDVTNNVHPYDHSQSQVG
ncbi:hypothetical protein PIB30_030430 [Stylosanthes scabra]|uniref:Uncharacterized protein n=1 Tax=Stylosanthes scabra TaxID=79078 RepID=A0ABU6QB39_9FABA|nr:hypothetical protein [Stylosanthes scabra]